MNNRIKDAEIAVNKYGWQWVNMYGIREILVPPADDERTHWTAMWDENGIPHYLPEYHKEETIRGLYGQLKAIEEEIGLLDGRKLNLMSEAEVIKEELDELGENVFL